MPEQDYKLVVVVDLVAYGGYLFAFSVALLDGAELAGLDLDGDAQGLEDAVELEPAELHAAGLLFYVLLGDSRHYVV